MATSTRNTKKAATGATFEPYFVGAGENPYSQVKWTKRTSQITDSGGRVVFSAEAVEVPEGWSQLATDIAVSKYFRKAGVPKTGHETSVKQLVHRVAHTIRKAGEKFGGYFATARDAEQFEKELAHVLLTQKGAFNSPVWFNCGLFHEYGIQGSGGSFAWDFTKGKPIETKNSYENPQCSACFIQSVDDDLMSIFDLVKNEARIFKFGSGTGTNFSKIRGSMEKLSGGGTSSGLMSFLEVLDRGAGATKSGGTTRRAAKMVSLDMDHPEIVDFISWKSREEKKVAALVEAGYSNDFNGDAYRTVGGQNSNNSVRIPDEFMQAVERDGEWHTTARTDGRVIATYKARELWDKVAQAAWECADPGVQFDSTIQKWHTCPETDRINGSNPCSEYMFLDDSACNLSSMNLVKFLRDDGSFDVESYRHAARVLFTAQEILVDFSSYPTQKIAQNSHDYRPLGLGYANLGTLLMIKGISYDSPEAVAWAGALTAIMHGEAFRTSAEMAKAKGPFPGYEKNAEAMMRVMKQHQAALGGIDSSVVSKDVWDVANSVWREAVALGAEHGYRNAQATVLAPTGTIGLLMDCDTTGIEPDFALVKFKKLAGGGYFKIVNQSVPKALKALGYTEKQIGEIVEYAVGTMSLEKAPAINDEVLKKRGANEV
ncbi:MAG: vitamin B12-dependent ribonucleotide reductase, partial [Bdellovibrionota bacterium]